MRRAVAVLLCAIGVALGAGVAAAETLRGRPLELLLYDATFVTQTAPTVVEQFVAAPVSVTMRNSGMAAWVAGDVFLATQEPQDNYYWCIQDNPYGSHSGNRVVLHRDVAAGETVTFDFVVKPLGCIFAAPAPLRFRMLSQTAGTFGDETPDPAVSVTTAAEFVDQQMPARAPAAASVGGIVTFRNTTTTTWPVDAGYTLVAANGTGATWTLAPPVLPAPVAPGTTVTIPFRFMTPTAPGTYPLQVQMSIGSKPFGQVSNAASIVVVAAGAPNYQGLWWAKPAGSESGWGINFADQDGVIFATWFTYDATGKAWWLTMTALPTGTPNAFSGDIFEQTGPPFSSVPFTPSAVRRTRVGSGTLTFTDARNGTFDYVVDGVHQTKDITPQVWGDLPTCTFGLVNDLSVAFNYQDLWWAAPAGAESGWGINLAQQGEIIFATWFTYAADRTPMWVSATAPKTDKATYEGAIVRTSGPAFDSVPFDPKAVSIAEVGTLKLTFRDGNAGTFDYTLDGVTQTKSITRQVFNPPGTICQ